MKIRMKVHMSGLRNGVPWPPVGELAELPTGEAQHLCASGIAEEATGDTPPEETATPSAAEVSELPAAQAAAPPAETKRGRGRPRKPTVPGE